jgi:hypothetical protein
MSLVWRVANSKTVRMRADPFGQCLARKKARRKQLTSRALCVSPSHRSNAFLSSRAISSCFSYYSQMNTSRGFRHLQYGPRINPYCRSRRFRRVYGAASLSRPSPVFNKLTDRGKFPNPRAALFDINKVARAGCEDIA